MDFKTGTLSKWIPKLAHFQNGFQNWHTFKMDYHFFKFTRAFFYDSVANLPNLARRKIVDLKIGLSNALERINDLFEANNSLRTMAEMLTSQNEELSSLNVQLLNQISSFLAQIMNMKASAMNQAYDLFLILYSQFHVLSNVVSSSEH